MKLITIPRQQHQNDDLIILPKKDYEKLLLRALKYEQEEAKLDPNLQKSLTEVEQGNMSEPFESSDELMKSLRL